ncbi:MAG TPA: ATP-binding protein [Verrucomicrobiae bacterium]|nr:ATP-binding protein [Verrucomicrobiae bacterium]
MQTLFVVTLITVSLVNLILGGVVIASGRKSLYHSYFFGLATAVFCWSAGIALFLGAHDAEMATVSAKIYYISAAIIGYCLLGLALTLPNADGHKPHRPLLAGLAIPLFGIVLLLLPDNLFIDQVVLQPGGNEVVLAAIPYATYTIYFMTCIVSAVFIIAKKYLRAKLLQKKIIAAQLGFILAGLLSAGLFGVLFNLLLPLFGNYKLIWAGPPFTLILVILVFYAIIRHGLFDVRRALAQSIAYVLSLISVGVMYGAAVFGVTFLLFSGEQLNMLQNIIYITLAIILAFTFHPLKSFFDRLTDKIFYRYDYDLQDVLNTLSDITTYEINLKRVSTKAAEFIASAIKASFVSVYVQNSEPRYYKIGKAPEVTDETVLLRLLKKQETKIIMTHRLELGDGGLRELLEANGITLVARLETSRELIGFMYYGEKLSGNFYNAKDIQVIRTAASELALAIQNSLRFAEINKFNETLQAKVDIATEKLRHTNQKLKQLDAAKDEFVSMASHQLRTPLTSIKGYLSMVIEGDAGKLNPTQEKLLKEAFTSSERMVRLIGDFLNVSRIRTGKFILEKSEVNLAELVKDEVEQLRSTADSRQLTLEYEAPSAIPTLQLDHNKIQQVIMNLIDNAIFYSHAGDSIKIELLKDDKNVVLRIKDTGIGVPAKEKPRLFTKFYRASNARRQRPDGTGIGLFMAQKIIVAHGGSIIFESEEGKGSTFGFRLPLKKK